jgi:DNA-binding Xre family transcriptional regulator
MKTMFTVTLKEMMELRDVKLYALAMDTRIAPTTLYRILENRGAQESIDLSVLSRLCTRLECTPNDLLKYVPDADDRLVMETMKVLKRKPGRPKKVTK